MRGWLARKLDMLGWGFCLWVDRRARFLVWVVLAPAGAGILALLLWGALWFWDGPMV